MSETYVYEFAGQNIRVSANQPAPRVHIDWTGYMEMVGGSIAIEWETLYLDCIQTEGNARYRVTIEEIEEDEEP